MGRKIAISEDGDRVVHAKVNLGNYLTLCALDESDPFIGTKNLGMTTDKINCPQCRSIFMAAKEFTKAEFK